MPESNEHYERGLQTADTLPTSSRGVRRHPLLCAECHRQFRTPEQLYLHSEVCIIESFENEAASVFSSMPSLMESAPVASTSHTGITAKGDGPPKLVPEACVLAQTPNSTNPSKLSSPAMEHPENDNTCSMPTAQTSRGASLSPCGTFVSRHQRRFSSESFKRKAFNVENALTLEGRNGLKIYVSVEKPLRREENDGDEAFERDGHDYGFTGPSHTSDALNRKGKVIGAIANADDDDGYRPKMECPACGLVLYRHNFGTHYRIHTGELPFICTYCEKRFRTTSALKVHIRAHTGEKPYSCPKCSYCCITKRNLDRHIINNHVREGERRGPRERRSRYRRDEYSVIINNTDASTAEDGENGKNDHHYVIATEEAENYDMVKDKTNENTEEHEAGDSRQPAEMPILPMLN